MIYPDYENVFECQKCMKRDFANVLETHSYDNTF